MTTDDRPEPDESTPGESTPPLPSSEAPPRDVATDAPAASTAEPIPARGAAPPAAVPAVTEPEAPATIADGAWHQLSQDYVKVQRIAGIFVLVMIFPPLMFVPFVIGFVQGIPWLAYSIPLAIGAIGVFSLWAMWVYASLHHKHAGYRVDGRQIEWRHGVWWRRVTIVPRTRVQHTDVSQGPLERRFGLGTLHIFTAGTENAKVSIHGLEHELAARIRDHLVQTDLGDAV